MTKTVTVELTDDEYAALLRLAADMKLRPNHALLELLRRAVGELGTAKLVERGGEYWLVQADGTEIRVTSGGVTHVGGEDA